MLIVAQTFNMPQTTIHKGLEVCYVKRLNVFAKFIHRFPVPSSSSVYIVLLSVFASHYGVPRAKASAMFAARKHRIARRGASTRV